MTLWPWVRCRLWVGNCHTVPVTVYTVGSIPWVTPYPWRTLLRSEHRSVVLWVHSGIVTIPLFRVDIPSSSRALGLVPSFPGWKCMMRLKVERNSDQHACCKTRTPPRLRPVGEGVSRIYSTTLLILLQHPVLQYILLYIEQKLYGLLWVPSVLYSYLVMIS